MALIVSFQSGNFNVASTWVGGVIPTIGDEAQAANGHTITITANATCDLVSNAGTGIFTLNDGVTLTANVTNKSSTTLRNCLQFTAASPASATIVGNCLGGTANNAVAVANTGTGTLNITGNCTGGSVSGAGAAGARNVSSGSINITGNCTGGSVGLAYAVHNSSTGNITVVGNATGGNGATTAYGVYNELGGTLTLNGIATGGSGTTSSTGAHNAATGTLNVTRAKGNAYGPGNTSGLSAVAGASNAALGILEIQELEFGTFGQSPVSGTGIRLRKANTNVAVFNYVDSGSAKTLVDATQGQMPAASNVRSGVSYASGALTGTCAVPSAGSVALGVPVDNTTGTAILTQANVQSALSAQGLTTARAGNLDNLDTTISSRLAPSGTLATVTNLTNAPASVTPADIWSHATRTLTSASGPTAVQIRQEMDSNSTKLANLDAAVSSRLAAASYTAPPTPPTAVQIRQEIDANSTKLDAAISTRATPANIPASDITAIKAKTDALNTDRLAQVATTNIVGTLLAQANS